MKLALLANAAPLLGIVLWLSPFSFTGGGGWDFAKMFMIGIYMALTGLVVPAIIWPLAPPGLAKTEAGMAVRFHGIIVAIPLGIALIAIANFLAAAFVFFAFATFVLPLVELVRVLIGVMRVRATVATSKESAAASLAEPSHPSPIDPSAE